MARPGRARRYLADHAAPSGASLIATDGANVMGYLAIVWRSNHPGFRSRGIPLVHQIAVAGPVRRRGVATLLMDAAEQLARDRGIDTLGLTVGPDRAGCLGVRHASSLVALLLLICASWNGVGGMLVVWAFGAQVASTVDRRL